MRPSALAVRCTFVVNSLTFPKYGQKLGALRSVTIFLCVSCVLHASIRCDRYITHSYLLNRQDQPECSHCDCELTVAHVLLECNHYNVVTQRYFNVSSLYELFDTVNAQNILGFIRDIGLYRLL